MKFYYRRTPNSIKALNDINRAINQFIRSHDNICIPKELINVWTIAAGCFFSDCNAIAVPSNPSKELLDSYFNPGFGCFGILPLADSEHCVSMLTTKHCDRFIHEKYLKIINDMCGNYVLINVDNQYRNYIYFYDHEEDCIIKAFNSLRDLFYSLRPVEVYSKDDIEDDLRLCENIDLELLFST